MKTIKGKLIDIVQKRIYNAAVHIENGRIESIEKIKENQEHYIIPGFIDSHVHIESSMLNPSEFSRLAIQQGTIATVSDPHEIANVCGVEGVEYMIKDAEKSPLKLHFNAPSCVPATPFETSGHVLDSNDIGNMLKKDKIIALGEMMNYPGVIHNDPEVHAKIKASHDHNKPVDGHAPEVTGKDAETYINAGISTDHECASLTEALEKINKGMIIQIREGSAAKNFDALHSLLSSHPEKCMLCTDDSHPNDLKHGHINNIVARAIKAGHNLFDVLRASSLNAAKHYNLNVGMLQQGDPADFIIVDSIEEFNVVSAYINGELVFDNGRILFQVSETKPINNFVLSSHLPANAFEITSDASRFKIIQAYDGSLITGMFEHSLPKLNGKLQPDPLSGINKIAVINRYVKNPKPAVAFVQGFGINRGAIASTVAHDSHNIVAVGVDDENIAKVVNKLIDTKGGLALTNEQEIFHLPLPVGGLMSSENGEVVAEKYKTLNSKSSDIGCILNAPFMTMAFMALLVIPKLKIGDKGLFDVSNFSLTQIEAE
ncbi:MAG: adenine deaminase [Bacteroidota bacterium]|nr:adenine deaminase [Bacteroidota bacterium]